MKTILVTIIGNAAFIAAIIGIAAFIAASIHINGGTFGQKCAGFEAQEYQKCLQRLSQKEPKP